jgi:hypothetical protein
MSYFSWAIYLFASANESTGKLFASASESTGKLFALANEQTGKIWLVIFTTQRAKKR